MFFVPPFLRGVGTTDFPATPPTSICVADRPPLGWAETGHTGWPAIHFVRVFSPSSTMLYISCQVATPPTATCTATWTPIRSTASEVFTRTQGRTCSARNFNSEIREALRVKQCHQGTNLLPISFNLHMAVEIQTTKMNGTK